MAFFAKYKVVRRRKTTTTKTRTFEEIVTDTIYTQRRILAGEVLRSNKKNKAGEYPPIKSWYNESRGTVSPKIGVYPLMGDNEIKMEKSQLSAFLDDLEQHWLTDPDLTPLFLAVKRKMANRGKPKDISI